MAALSSALAVMSMASAPMAEEPETAEISAEDLAALQTAGLQIYKSDCSSCHGAEGQGGAGPPLANNAFLGNLRGAVGQIIYGGAYMPGFPQLNNERAANLLTYLRTSLGNDLGHVTAEQIAEVR